MQTLQELGEPESLSRFERGRSAEFGARKLLAVLAVLEAELDIVAQGQAGNLDELRRERAQSTSGPTVDAPGTSSEGRR